MTKTNCKLKCTENTSDCTEKSSNTQRRIQIAQRKIQTAQSKISDAQRRIQTAQRNFQTAQSKYSGAQRKNFWCRQWFIDKEITRNSHSVPLPLLSPCMCAFYTCANRSPYLLVGKY